MVARPATRSTTCWRSGALALALGGTAVVACGGGAAGDGPSWVATEAMPTGSGPADGEGGTPGSEAATGETDTPTGDGADDAPGPPECDAPQIACGNLCADLESDPANCGECGRTCVIPQGMPACTAGECTLSACATGFADCDGDVATGCEQMVDCTEGAACSTTCETTGATSCADVCSASCTPPAEACNVLDDDCDGECDEGPVAGCRVGVHRSNGPSLGHFYTTSLAEATSGDLTLEAQDYFFVVAAPTEGLQPMFRCQKPNGKRWYTSSTDCEGTAAPELTVGFWSADEKCGAIPLYRLRNAPADAHFYTTSAAERDNAVTALGFVDEGIAAYVFTAL